MRWSLAVLALASCGSSPTPIDIDDVDLPAPGPMELESRLKAYRSGTERLHADPKQVAHVALLHHLDLPWRGDPYRPDDYEFHERSPEHPEWGSYVVRGWVERTGSPRVRRYRVKVRPYEGIWYPIQVSHYILVDVPEDGPNEGPPNVRK